MERPNKLNEKIYQYLLHLLDDAETEFIYDFLVHSDIYQESDYGSAWSKALILTIVSAPESYKKHRKKFPIIKEQIEKIIFDFTETIVTDVRIFPDLKKFQILNNRYTPIVTPWEEINNFQNIILEQLRTATETIQYQNIGNTGRTIMQKISDILFDPATHKAPANIDLSEGKFKNRLHTYIKTTLGGHQDKEIRDYALSVIDTAEKSIDLANKLTHSLNADSFIAESCVISTISAINLLKIINNRNK